MELVHCLNEVLRVLLIKFYKIFSYDYFIELIKQYFVAKLFELGLGTQLRINFVINYRIVRTSPYLIKIYLFSVESINLISKFN